jgi:hypothetical protein
MRVIVAGAVAWADRSSIHRELAGLGPGAEVIHGDSPGADKLGGEVAAELGHRVRAMAKNPQDRARYGRDAWKGLNERMVQERPERVLIFHPDIEGSRGSKHLRDLCWDVGINVQIFTC